jgi:hypothetical protein
MRPLNVELLLSHESGISDYYYRPTEKEVLDDYLKAVDLLTINLEKATLKQVKEQTEKSEEEVHLTIVNRHSASCYILLVFFFQVPCSRIDQSQKNALQFLTT